MKKEFEVTISEKMHHKYAIHAEDYEEAIEKAKSMHHNTPFTALDSLVDDDVDIEVVEYA